MCGLRVQSLDSACNDVAMGPGLYTSDFPMGHSRLYGNVVVEICRLVAFTAHAPLPGQCGQSAKRVVLLARTVPELVESRPGPVGAFVASPYASLFAACAAFVGHHLSSMAYHFAFAAQRLVRCRVEDDVVSLRI